MPVHSLLARIRDPHLVHAGGAPETAIRASILEHLRVLCSTRRGTVEMRPDYGIPDISEMVHSFPVAIDSLASALRETISKYERRLTSVRVAHVPSDAAEMVVRFEITASLAAGDRAAPVRFETRIDSSRRVNIT